MKVLTEKKLLKHYKKSLNPFNSISYANSEYDKQISVLQEVLDRHAPSPLRRELLEGINLSKAIMKRSQLKTSIIKLEKRVIGMRSKSNVTCASNSDRKL